MVARFIPGGTTVTRSLPARGPPWRRFIRYDVVAGGIWATYAAMLGYIGGKPFEEQPWKGVILGFGIAFGVTRSSSGAAP